MSYSHYNSVPGWGTNQVRFGAPPAPAFQPQPSWGGIDYYRAHAPNGSPDLDVYGHAWDRVRDVRDFSASGGLGVGIHEAQHWHRRAYGGLIDLNELLPAEIGHAAAYEAFRTWIHNSSIYEPLSGEMERQREGLIGLAVAEAMRLLGFTAHTMDPYFRRATSEAAAMTSSILFYWNRDHGDDERRGRGRGSEYDDPYAYDNDLAFPRRGRSHSRRRSHSVSSYNGIPSMAGSAVGMAPSAMPPTPYPGQVATYAGQGQPGAYAGGYPGQQGGYGQAASYGGYAGQAGSYGGQQGSYGGQQVPYGAQYPGGGAGVPMPMPGAGYASSDPAGYGTPFHGQSNVPMVAPVHGSRRRALSTSVPYAGTSYGGAGSSYGGMGSSYGGGGMIQGLPQPINGVAPQVVVVKSHRKHRHHHHSKHRSRSHSRY